MATDVKNDPTLSTGLLSYWELEEASGTRVDSHTGGNNLADNNTVTQTTGIQGNAASFVNANTEYLSIASPSGMTLTNAASMSWAFWLKTTSDIVGGGGPCLSSRWSGTSKGWLFRLNTTTQVMECFLGDGLTTRSAGSGTTDLSDQAWHHVVITFDHTDDKLRLYVDGNTTPELTSAALTISQSTAVMEIGNNATAGSAAPFDGLIDEFGIWTKALSTGEVTDLYNSGTGIPYDAGTVSTNASRRLLFMGF